jgi:hypothetical protein
VSNVAALLTSLGYALAPIATVLSAWILTRRKSKKERHGAAQGAADQLIGPDARLVQAIAEELAKRDQEGHEDG